MDEIYLQKVIYEGDYITLDKYIEEDYTIPHYSLYTACNGANLHSEDREEDYEKVILSLLKRGIDPNYKHTIFGNTAIDIVRNKRLKNFLLGANAILRKYGID